MSQGGEEGEPKVPSYEYSKTVTFVIPFLPPSSNAIYQVLYNFRRIQLKPSVAMWKSKAKEYIPKIDIRDKCRISVALTFCGGWYYKNGNMKREDLPNLIKIVIDAIAEKQGWDDKIVWELAVFANKVEWDGQEKIRGEIKCINDSSLYASSLPQP